MVKKCKNCNCDCEEREAFYQTFEDGKPYEDFEVNGRLIRKFSKDTKPHLLKWHSDEEDRVVFPLNENDWQFQFDNNLPIPIDGKLKIKKGIYHRIIKGTTDLILQIDSIPELTITNLTSEK
jgi:hypothetical protein